MTASEPVLVGSAAIPGRRTAGDGWSSAALVASLALLASLLAMAAGWRGEDLPAQIYRMDLVRHHGLVLWDNQWFAGHPTLGYSVLAPVLGALIGPLPLAAASGLAAAVLFDRIVTGTFGSSARVGSIWFAIGTVSNLVVGRVTFALGLALALGAVLAMQHGRRTLAAGLALLTPLASPLAGLFLAIAAGGVFLGRRAGRGQAAAVALAASLPILVVAAAFPDAGSFPYQPWAFGRDLLVCALLYAVARDRAPVVAWGSLAYAAVVVGSFVVASPVGGNVSRLPQYVAGPLLACLLLPAHRRWLLALAVPLLVWQWVPAVDGIAFAPADPSTQRAYYEPLLTYLRAEGATGRIEVPSTERHWEAAYVAPSMALARGWERQTDIGNNPSFYDGTLTADSYRRWLIANAVEYVALPDTRLDSSSIEEASILRAGQPFLEPVWSDDHWRVWRVAGYRGLVDGPARLIHHTPTSFTLEVTGSGPITMRVHSSPHWAVDGRGCVAASPDGWTVIHGAVRGTLEVEQQLGGTPCPNPSD